jgi:hypothetical protein
MEWYKKSAEEGILDRMRRYTESLGNDFSDLTHKKQEIHITIKKSLKYKY